MQLGGLRSNLSSFIQHELGGVRDSGLPEKAIIVPDPPSKRLREVLDLAESDLTLAVEGLVSHARRDYPEMELPPTAKWTLKDKEARQVA